MSLTDDMQQHIQTRLDFSSPLTGEARGAGREETEKSRATNGSESPVRTDRLMEEVCERENLKEALQRVKGNKGSVGVDGVTTDGLRADEVRRAAASSTTRQRYRRSRDRCRPAGVSLL